jgi:hypothetical protein
LTVLNLVPGVRFDSVFANLPAEESPAIRLGPIGQREGPPLADAHSTIVASNRRACVTASGGGLAPITSDGGLAPITSGGGLAPITSGGGSAPITSGGGSAPITSDGGLAPITSDGGLAPITSDGGLAPITSGGGSAPITSDGGSAPITSGGGCSRTNARLESRSHFAHGVKKRPLHTNRDLPGLALWTTRYVAADVFGLRAEHEPNVLDDVVIGTVTEPKPPRPSVQAAAAFVVWSPVRRSNDSANSARPLEAAVCPPVLRNAL